MNSPFELHAFSSRTYTAAECITFGNKCLSLSVLDAEMQHHKGVSHIMVCDPTQEEFDQFVAQYADQYASIYFFHMRKVKDLSLLSTLQHVQWLLIHNAHADALWDMQGNLALRGLMVSESKKTIYDLEPLVAAPSLDEVILLSSMDRKYTTRSLAPLLQCSHLRRVMIELNTESKDFRPEDYVHLDAFQYQVDRKRNF